MRDCVVSALTVTAFGPDLLDATIGMLRAAPVAGPIRGRRDGSTFFARPNRGLGDGPTAARTGTVPDEQVDYRSSLRAP